MKSINDPVEKIIADALDAAGIAYVHESERMGQTLDFEIVNGPFIECKQFSTPRTAGQIEGVSNVIVIQGVMAARWFSDRITPPNASKER